MRARWPRNIIKRNMEHKETEVGAILSAVTMAITRGDRYISAAEPTIDIPTIDTNSYIFNFGQCDGQSYSSVLSSDPEYINWCHHTIEWFNLDRAALAELEGARYDARPCERPHTCSDFGYQTDWGHPGER